MLSPIDAAWVLVLALGSLLIGPDLARAAPLAAVDDTDGPPWQAQAEAPTAGTEFEVRMAALPTEGRLGDFALPVPAAVVAKPDPVDDAQPLPVHEPPASQLHSAAPAAPAAPAWQRLTLTWLVPPIVMLALLGAWAASRRINSGSSRSGRRGRYRITHR